MMQTNPGKATRVPQTTPEEMRSAPRVGEVNKDGSYWTALGDGRLCLNYPAQLLSDAEVEATIAQFRKNVADQREKWQPPKAA